MKISSMLTIAAVIAVAIVMQVHRTLTQQKWRALRCESEGGLAVRRGFSYGVVCIDADTVAISGRGPYPEASR